jgi:hypothetical protein
VSLPCGPRGRRTTGRSSSRCCSRSRSWDALRAADPREQPAGRPERRALGRSESPHEQEREQSEAHETHRRLDVLEDAQETIHGDPPPSARNRRVARRRRRGQRRWACACRPSGLRRRRLGGATCSSCHRGRSRGDGNDVRRLGGAAAGWWSGARSDERIVFGGGVSAVGWAQVAPRSTRGQQGRKREHPLSSILNGRHAGWRARASLSSVRGKRKWVPIGNPGLCYLLSIDPDPRW